MKKFFYFMLFIFFLLVKMDAADYSTNPKEQETPDSLAVLWATADKDVFKKVIMPYTYNSKKNEWWVYVEIIIWGPSTKLLAEDEELQKILKTLKESGVVFTACLWCADQYGATDKLKGLGIDVKYMGKPLTNYLKSGWRVLTF